MAQTLTVEKVKDLLYRCLFKDALSAIESLAPSATSGELFSLRLYEVQALFEGHKTAEAKNLLEKLTATTGLETEAYLYVSGRMAYLDGNYEDAEGFFKALIDKSESVQDYYRALIGLANIYYSQERFDRIRPIMSEIEELSDVVPEDSRLSYLLLKATVLYAADSQIGQAKQLHYKVIASSQKRGWTYFIIKSLYGLATICSKENNKEALEANLQLLRCYLDPSEAVFLAYLVNNKFKEDNFAVSSPVSFDMNLKRVGIGGQWVALHDKPLLFKFLELLNSKGRFVSKQELAEYLWPTQQYKQKSHDPRIFDIARRIRQLIEPYDQQPVSLLSGRYGYKLAKTEASPKKEMMTKAPLNGANAGQEPSAELS